MTEKDLVEIIRRQSEQIDQLIAENKALKVEIARLKKRIEELERKERRYAAPDYPSKWGMSVLKVRQDAPDGCSRRSWR